MITLEGRELVALPEADAQARISNIDATVRKERRLASAQRKRTDPRPSSTEVIADDPDRNDMGDLLDPADDDSWHEPLLRQIHALSDDAFERLAQVVLQSYGLVLEHTGGTGDDGIDCLGVAPVSEVMSATVAVQAKRREPSARVGRDAVALLQRDASNAGAERAIMVTSGKFT